QFPDNSRRRIPAVMYVVIAALSVLVWWLTKDSDTAVVNDGFLYAALLFFVFGLYGLSASWRMKIDEREALVRATQAVNFAVGHASAQQVWRGVIDLSVPRSRTGAAVSALGDRTLPAVSRSCHHWRWSDDPPDPIDGG
ncbi:MAG: hypothetical protein ACO3NZ_16030, partial [Pirellulales bacterium]